MSESNLEKSEQFYRTIKQEIESDDIGFFEAVLKSAVSSNVVPIEDVEQFVLFEFRDSFFRGDYIVANRWLIAGQIVSVQAINLEVANKIRNEDREFFAFVLSASQLGIPEDLKPI